MSTCHVKLSRISPICSLILLCFFDIDAIIESSATEFDFRTLTLSSLRLLGDAHLNNGSVILTRDLAVPNSGAGRSLYGEPVRFRNPTTRSPASFSTFFSFSVVNLNPSSIGGGLAFVISPDGDSVGAAGGSLGLIWPDGSGSGFVAVEFDTFMDAEFKDINGNHVGLDLNGVISSQIGDLETIAVDLKSGDIINSWIDYDGSGRVINISVSYSNLKPKSPIISVPLDLNQYVNDFMYVGFSGSTQGSTERHSIEWWSFSSSLGSDPGSGSGTTRTPPPTANVMKSPPPPPHSLAPETSQKSSKSSSCHNQLCKHGPGAVAGVVTAGAFFLALFAGGFFWIYTKKLKNVKRSESFASDFIKTPKEFSYKELKTATKNFSTERVIGNGAFGTVYKGILPDSGEIVAVKRCSHNSQGKTEFLSELSIIGMLRHRNLVKLQGWCHEKGEILLVYDLMPNGSLDKALFESRFLLTWPHRRKILLGVASALAYLHQECENQVIHRDIKTSNIMLDEGFNARLGDFGLAREVEHDKSPGPTVAAGTMGYLAPEYLLTGRATDKTDVFSFGAVVLEVASGRRPIAQTEANVKINTYNSGKNSTRNERGSNLVEWVWGLYRENRVLAAADPRLEGGFDKGEMVRVLMVGLACSQPDPMARPAMRTVVQMLVGEADVPEVPKAKPTLSFSTSHLLLSLQDSVSDCNDLVPVSTSSSSELNTFIAGNDQSV